MQILVVGATGGSGRATVEALSARGHRVTALVRRLDAGHPFPSGVRVIEGDATRADDIDRAVAGQDAVVVTLGIREPALKVRLLGSARTPLNVRSVGTALVIGAMRRHDVRKLVVQTSYGVGSTRSRLSLKWRAIFALLLKPQIADTEVQELAVRTSGLDWVVAQPVALTDGVESEAPFTSPDGTVRSMAISRRRVATFLAEATESAVFNRQVVSLS
jgi:hypothetical protein